MARDRRHACVQCRNGKIGSREGSQQAGRWFGGEVTACQNCTNAKGGVDRDAISCHSQPRLLRIRGLEGQSRHRQR